MSLSVKTKGVLVLKRCLCPKVKMRINMVYLASSANRQNRPLHGPPTLGGGVSGWLVLGWTGWCGGGVGWCCGVSWLVVGWTGCSFATTYKEILAGKSTSAVHFGWFCGPRILSNLLGVVLLPSRRPSIYCFMFIPSKSMCPNSIYFGPKVPI